VRLASPLFATLKHTHMRMHIHMIDTHTCANTHSHTHTHMPKHTHTHKHTHTLRHITHSSLDSIPGRVGMVGCN
jgi:hypothetical protein